MTVRLLFITSHYFLQPTQDALNRLDIPCETKVLAYDNFAHISQLYREHADQYDACFTSGVIARQAIEMGCPNIRRPLIAFQISPDTLHRDILRFIADSGTMDFNRIAMDFLLPLDMGYSVTDFLKLEEIEEVYSRNAMETTRIGARDGFTIENLVLDRITDLWERKAIDLVICQYSSIIPALQQRGIPYRCSFVSDQHLNSLIQEVLSKLELQKLQENHPVIVQIFSRDISPFSSQQQRSIHGCVKQFLSDNLMECVIQDSSSCCTIITSVRYLRFLTDDFQVCRLSSALEQMLDFPVLVGYGIGTTVPHAMNNVQLACKESKIMGKPFIVDTKGCLIGPLNSENRMVLTFNSMPDVSQIAKRCSLSAMTIQKIIAMVRSNGIDKITTQDLALRLNTTLRNANRIMINLCKGNVAQPVYTQATHSRGRPVQVYSLDFDICSP